MTTPVLLATLVLFVLYEIVFRQSGLWLSRLVGIEAGSHTFGESRALVAALRRDSEF